jgi:hypothetical protein
MPDWGSAELDATVPRGGRCDIFALHLADVAELVDAHGSGPCPGNWVEVRVLSSALVVPRGVRAYGYCSETALIADYAASACCRALAAR